MDRYRKKPVVIEAVRWEGGATAATPIIDWILDGGGTARYHEPDTKPVGAPYRPDDINSVSVPEHIVIDTLEGKMRAKPGDWIIRGVQGEFYPCNPYIFTQTYERA